MSTISSEATTLVAITTEELIGLLGSADEHISNAYLSEAVKRDNISADYTSALRAAYTLETVLQEPTATMQGLAGGIAGKLYDYYCGCDIADEAAWSLAATTARDLAVEEISVDVSSYPTVVITLDLKNAEEGERPKSEIVDVTVVIEAQSRIEAQGRGWNLTLKETKVSRAP